MLSPTLMASATAVLTAAKLETRAALRRADHVFAARVIAPLMTP
jgi:hypothetical protein